MEDITNEEYVINPDASDVINAIELRRSGIDLIR
jgi:hypothetical protein